MHSFTDATGQTWDLNITFAVAKRLRNEGLDLLNIDEVNEQLADPIKAVDLLYYIVKPQAVEMNVSDEEFGNRLAKMLDDKYVAHMATEALVGAIERFFTMTGRPTLAKIVRTTWNASNKIQTKGSELISGENCRKKIDQMISMGLAEMQEEIDKLGGEMS